MVIHWPSFLLGLAALPALAAGVALGWLVISRVAQAARSSGHPLNDLPGPGPSSRRPEPLQFNPRLIGQIRDSIARSRDSAEVS